MADKVQIIGNPETPGDDYVIEKTPLNKEKKYKNIIQTLVSPGSKNTTNQIKIHHHQKSKSEKTKSYEMER